MLVGRESDEGRVEVFAALDGGRAGRGAVKPDGFRSTREGACFVVEGDETVFGKFQSVFFFFFLKTVETKWKNDNHLKNLVKIRQKS